MVRCSSNFTNICRLFDSKCYISMSVLYVYRNFVFDLSLLRNTIAYLNFSN